MTPRQRLEPEARKAQIIEAALQCATKDGLSRFTRDQIATRAGCSPSLVSYYWLDMGELLSDVMEIAVSRPVLRVVAQGLAVSHPVALGAPVGVREAAAGALVAHGD